MSTKIVDDRETRVEAFGEYRHIGDEDSSDGKVVFGVHCFSMKAGMITAFREKNSQFKSA